MKLEHTGVSIVVLGTFRPDSFRPKALVDAKIISPKDAALSEILTLVTGQIVNFKLPWATVLVDSTRFQLATIEAPYIRICDLAVKALSDLDTKFSVSAIGINYEAHVNLGSYQARDAIGTRLAPPNVWGQWGESILKSLEHAPPNRLHGGVMGMTMRLPFVSELAGGWRDITVSPSGKIKGDTGIQIRTNHHFILLEAFLDETQSPENPTKEDSNGILLKVLAEQFDQSIKEAETVFNQVVTV